MLQKITLIFDNLFLANQYFSFYYHTYSINQTFVIGRYLCQSEEVQVYQDTQIALGRHKRQFLTEFFLGSLLHLLPLPSPPPLEVNLKAIDIPPPPLGAPLPHLSCITNHLVPSLPLLFPQRNRLLYLRHITLPFTMHIAMLPGFLQVLQLKIAILFIQQRLNKKTQSMNLTY